MKKIFLAASFLAVSLAGRAQERIYPWFVQYADWCNWYGACLSSDWNNDGTVDLLIAGFGRNVTNPAGVQDHEKIRMTHVLLYNPDPFLDLNWEAVSDSEIGVNVTDRPTLETFDLNGDGIQDLAAWETCGMRWNDQPYTSGLSRQGLFLGNGDGTFTQYNPRFVDAEGNSVEIDLARCLSGTVCDLNGDGLLDFATIGYHAENGKSAADYPIYNNVYLNQGGDTFLVRPLFADDEKHHFEMAWMRHYDLNNDGRQDLIISGQRNDAAVLGTQATCIYGDNCEETHFFDIFLNEGGTFAQQRMQDKDRWGSNTLYAFGETSLSIADFNNDGTPDFYVVGYCGTGRKHDVHGLYLGEIQDDGTVVYKKLASSGVTHARPLNTVQGQNLAGDWDGDGNYDLIVSGWYESLGTQTAFIYTNPHGTAHLTKAYRCAGSSEFSSCFVDWNADGRMDWLEMGQSWDGSFFLTGQAHIQCTLNPSTAEITAPAAPILFEPIEGVGTVTLSWQQPESALPNVTYEYFVRDSQGRYVVAPSAFVGGSRDGLRKVYQPGNACQARTITLALPAGSYTYGVQTVDAAYRGSEFAEGSFEVKE